MAVFTACKSEADRISQKYGLPPGLLYALLLTESGCRSDAVGPPTKYGTALGIGQFLPSTFSGLGCPGSPLNPVDGINCAGLYLSRLRSLFGGSNALAVAGYHAGEGRVEKTAPCVPGTSDGLSTTLNYVKGILAKAGLPFDAKDCSKGTNTSPTNTSPTFIEPLSPEVRRYLILGIGFILIVLALGRVAR
jgi:hypothetical protein